MKNDISYIDLALKEAKNGFDKGEVPIGAVLIREDGFLLKGHNLVETLTDVTAHAELLLLKQMSKEKQNRYLDDCTMYVTLEPCPMCAYAMVLARVKRLVFGASDLRLTAWEKTANLVRDICFDHKIEITSGIKAQECADLLQDFFQKLRRD